MHNRVRMIAARSWSRTSSSTGASASATSVICCVDGDVSQNVGNWQWVAGTGPDASPYHRIFNPVTQSRKFDPTGAYIRRWVPELAGLDDKAIHAPWDVAPLELAAAGVTWAATTPTRWWTTPRPGRGPWPPTAAPPSGSAP